LGYVSSTFWIQILRISMWQDLLNLSKYMRFNKPEKSKTQNMFFNHFSCFLIILLFSSFYLIFLCHFLKKKTHKKIHYIYVETKPMIK
jgi:hypothetical protein